MNNKGFTYSPFMLAALVLIGLVLSLYFIEGRVVLESGIKTEAALSRAALDLAELRLSLDNYLVFSAEAALDSGRCASAGELELFLESELDSRLRDELPSEVSYREGNFSLVAWETTEGRVGIRSRGSPRACIDRGFLVCSNLSVGEVIDREWIF